MEVYLLGVKLLGISLVGIVVGCKSDELAGEIPPARQLRATSAGEPQARLNKVTKTIKRYDRLELFVTEDPKFNGVYTVRESGDIIIPIVGRIPVEGSLVKDAEKTIKERLERGQLTKATVLVDRLLTWRWFGENRNRGYGRYVGYGERDLGGSRTGGASGSLGSNGGSSTDGEVMFFMTGKVNSPGQKTLPLPAGRLLGVYEAILMSGGLGRFGDAKKVHIMRIGKSGKRVKVRVNIKKIMEGELADIPIGEGDVIVVPEKVFGF